MNDITDFIKTLPESSKRKRTFLEIMQVSTRETIMANLLAFYFQPDEVHGLGDLFIKALLRTPCYELEFSRSSSLPDEIEALKDQKIKWAKVHTEDVTSDNKRIDIVIETDQLVIAIEFKINHSLNNPLNTYVKHISQGYPEDKPKYFVVLTPIWKQPEKDCGINTLFRQVLLNPFIGEIENLMKENPSLYTKTELQYQYFKDFITTIKNRKITFEMIKKYQERAENDDEFHSKIDQVYRDLQKIKLELENKMSAVTKGLNNFTPIGSSTNKLQTVIEKKLGSENIKLRLSLNGWSLEQWSQKQKLGHKTIHFPYPTSPEKIIEGVKSFEGELVDSVPNY